MSFYDSLLINFIKKYFEKQRLTPNGRFYLNFPSRSRKIFLDTVPLQRKYSLGSRRKSKEKILQNMLLEIL